MEGKEIVKLAAQLATGLVTEQFITEKFGNDVLAKVLGVGLGVVTGKVAGDLIDDFDKQTGLVSDVGGVVDDAIDTVSDAVKSLKFW